VKVYFRVVALFFLISLSGGNLFGLDYTWSGGGAGDWDVDANWNNNPGYPDDGGDTATIGVASTITLTNPRTINTLTINSAVVLVETAAESLTVNGTTSLNNNLSGGGLDLSFSAINSSGNYGIDTTTGRITVSGVVNGGGNSISFDSGSGNLDLTGTSSVTNCVNLDLDTTFTAAPLWLPDITITGDLTVTATSAVGIENRAGIDVGLKATIIGSSGTTIDFSNLGTIALGWFSFIGDDVHLNETGDTILAGGAAAGPLNIQSTGNISSTGTDAISIGDNSTFSANGGAGTNTFLDAITITGNSTITLTATTSSFNNTIDDDGGGRTFALNAGANALVVNAAIGGTPFASAAFTGNTINLGANITTSGALDLTGTVTVTNNVTLTSTGGSITFDGTVDDDAGNRNLTVNASVNTVLTAGTSAVGSSDRLGDLTVSGGTFVTNDNAVSIDGTLGGAGTCAECGSLSF